MFSDADHGRQMPSAADVGGLKTLDRVDKRTRLWRQREKRRAEIVASMGGADRIGPYERELIDLLLGLNAVVEDYNARLHSGEEIDTERYLSAVKEQRRVNGELDQARKAKPTRTLKDHLRRRADAPGEAA